jgi:creatinine amidohydrolase
MLTMFNTSWDVAESSVDTAVLPLGSLEPKGPHLPVGLDLILANRFARDFCTGKAVYLLPVFPFSSAMETMGFPGTVSLRQKTIWKVINDLVSILARHRFKRIVILDFSNYNWIVKQAAREVNMDRELLQAVWVKPKAFLTHELGPELSPDHGGGALETSLALHLAGGLVGPAPAAWTPDKPREYIDYHGLKAVAPEGYWGRPDLATADVGSGFYERMLSQTREYIEYALKLFPEGEPLKGDDIQEKWWPQTDMPGTEVDGLDWNHSLASLSRDHNDLAIIPTGATEQHSPSQPLATDTLQAVEWSRRVADRLGAYLLPTLPIFTSWGHVHYRGTLTFGSMTARRVLEDIVASLRAGGFKRAALLNVHGGNWVLKPTMVEINRCYDDFTLISVEDLLAYRGQLPVEQLHACENEASFIQAYYPEAFRAGEVVDYSPQCPAAAFDQVGIGGVSPKGVWGYPSRGSVEKGLQGLETRVNKAVAYITNTFEDV